MWTIIFKCILTIGYFFKLTWFQMCCSSSRVKCDANTHTDWFNAPIVHIKSTSITLKSDSCVWHDLLGLHYMWWESPCLYKKCPIYCVTHNLPIWPFIKLWCHKSISDGYHTLSEEPQKLSECIKLLPSG